MTVAARCLWRLPLGLMLSFCTTEYYCYGALLVPLLAATVGQESKPAFLTTARKLGAREPPGLDMWIRALRKKHKTRAQKPLNPEPTTLAPT